MEKIKITWDRTALVAILLVSGFLGFFSAWNEGYGKRYFMLSGTTSIQNGARIGSMTRVRGARDRTGNARAGFGFGQGTIGT
jgi:hypothetical protein